MKDTEIKQRSCIGCQYCMVAQGKLNTPIQFICILGAFNFTANQDELFKHSNCHLYIRDSNY